MGKFIALSEVAAGKQTHPNAHTQTHRHTHIFTQILYVRKRKKEIKKMELLTVVLTILADGGFVLQCLVIMDNKEIYLEDVEALEFL